MVPGLADRRSYGKAGRAKAPGEVA